MRIPTNTFVHLRSARVSDAMKTGLPEKISAPGVDKSKPRTNHS
jgi:hypothetical protein